MRFVIVGLIGGEIDSLYTKISNDVSSRFSIGNVSNKIQCHITLKYPFESTEIEINRVERIVESVADTTKKADFNISGFGSFDHKTIFLKIEDEKFIKYLKSSILQLGHFDEDRKFDLEKYTPHLSVCRNIPEADFPNIWDYITTTYDPKLIGQFDNISILVEQDAIWKIWKRYDLKGDS